MSIAQEFDSINGATVSSSLSFETNPGRYVCKIESVDVSPSDYQGTPYFLVKMKSHNDKEIQAKLWRAKSGDTAEKKNNKESKIKKFCTDAGVDLAAVKGTDVLKALVGKSIKCMFTSSEYIGVDKHNANKPCIKTSLSLWYTDEAEADMQPISEDKAYQKLSSADEQKLAQEMDTWNMNNGGGSPSVAPSAQTDDEDDLPF